MLALPLIAMSGAWANGATEGYLPGKFSVSADKQVYFSKGNLQATTTDLGASWTWAFAEHQWDYVGKAAANTAINGNGTVSTNGTVDLFSWVGASSTWTGGAQYGIINFPGLDNVNDYGTGENEPLKSDWGNCIGEGWYTLSYAEWKYLLNNANETRANKYGIGTVHGKLGLIILPDGYEAPSGISTTFVPGTTNTTYSDADWSAMEAAGAVFLPAAGEQDIFSGVVDVGSVGYYWSSSADGANLAYTVFFNSGVLDPATYSHRYWGFSVRLVYEDPNPKVTWDATNKQGTFKMPAGNVEVSVEYYQPTELAWKQGTAAVPEGGVSAYKGFPTTLPALANPNSHTVSYTSSNPAAATIDADGKITLVGAGTTTIQATFAGDDTYEETSASYTLNVFLPATLTLKSSNDAWGKVSVDGLAQDGVLTTIQPKVGAATTDVVYSVPDRVTVTFTGEELLYDSSEGQCGWNSYLGELMTIEPKEGFTITRIECDLSNAAEVQVLTKAPFNIRMAGYAFWAGTSSSDPMLAEDYGVLRSLTVYGYEGSGSSEAVTGVLATETPGQYSIIPGTEVTAKATPADGYHLDCWSNNAEVNDAGTQTFTMGEDDMELTAFFEDNTPTNVATFAAANVFTIEGGKAVVKVNADAKTLNENQELNVKAGSTITIEAKPGYKIKSVKVKKDGSAPLKVPLTMEALTDGTIVVSSPQAGMQYTLNGGEKKAVTADAIEVVAGDKVAFYGNGTSISKYYVNWSNNTKIVGGTADVMVYGNIMSLVDEENYATATTLTEEYVFSNLFNGNTHLLDASDLLLPATTLSNYCYCNMFYKCTNLTVGPELPATTLAVECYYMMFLQCTSLAVAPELPATTLAERCYFCMFSGCSSLTVAPELPATTLAESCYDQMFTHSGLTVAPELPATTLAPQCYGTMFWDCQNLTTAPALPATTLAEYCYGAMFQECPNLTTAPVLPATTMVEGCYNYMFNGCTQLNSVTCLATSGLNAKNCTQKWLEGAAATGTFTASSSTNWTKNSVSGIPSGWTRVNYQP